MRQPRRDVATTRRAPPVNAAGKEKTAGPVCSLAELIAQLPIHQAGSLLGFPK